MFFSYFNSFVNWRPIISGCTGPIFTKFSRLVGSMGADERSDFFPILRETLRL